MVPEGIVAAMTEYGQQRLRDTDAPGSFHEELESLAADDQRAWVEALSQAIVPVGGVAAYGASTLVMLSLGHPVEFDAYCRLLDMALDYLRAEGVPEVELSGNERSYWRRKHPDEVWLEPATASVRSTPSSAKTCLPVTGSILSLPSSCLSRAPVRNRLGAGFCPCPCPRGDIRRSLRCRSLLDRQR
jgi:hypothetical protein